MEKDYKRMFELLDKYIKENVLDVDKTILNAIAERKAGKKFSFKEHIQGMILAMLSGQGGWKRVYVHKQDVDNLFFHYDKDKIRDCNPQYFINRIYQYKIGSRSTKKQMQALKHNILVLEKLEKEYESLDNFITHDEAITIVKMLADTNSEYKLVQLAEPLVCEYLRNVGIDVIKPDIHIKTILSPERLNLISSQSNYKIIEICNLLSIEIDYAPSKIDYLLWNYSADGYGEICTTKNPKCSQCVIKEFCNYPQKNIIPSIKKDKGNNKPLKKTNISNNEDYITSLRNKYTEYLFEKLKGKKERTIKTYVGDSFYVYKHQNEFNSNFFEILSNKQNIGNFEKELFEQQVSRHIELPSNSTKAYMNGLYRLYDFLNINE